MTYANWALGMGRAAAVDLMLDTVTITRPTGEPGEYDPVTGERGPAPTTTVYTGPGKVQTYEPYETTQRSGEHMYVQQRYYLQLPITATTVAVGDTATVTASANDPALAGRSYRVAGEHAKSWATARRVLIDEVVA